MRKNEGRNVVNSSLVSRRLNRISIFTPLFLLAAQYIKIYLILTGGSQCDPKNHEDRGRRFTWTMKDLDVAHTSIYAIKTQLKVKSHTERHRLVGDILLVLSCVVMV